MEDIMKIGKSVEDSGLLIKDVIQTIENEAKEQRSEFLSMPLINLGASLMENMLKVKE